MAETWPYDIPVFLQFRQTGQSVSAGRALDGNELTVANAGGYWTASGTVKLHRRSFLSYRGLYAALNGRSGRVLVPALSRNRPTDMNGRMVSSATANPIGFAWGRQGLGDNSGLGHREVPIMRTVGPSTLRDTRIVVSHPNVAPLQPGHYFGIGERLYLVSRRWMVEREQLTRTEGGRLTYGGSGLEYDSSDLFYGAAGPATRSGTNTSVVEFWPPLREDVAGGTALILGRPVCRMQFASDDTGAPPDDESRYGEVSVEFTEAA